jgi:beta-glucosidase
MSVEWARIEPEEGKFDMEAVAHYQKVGKALQKRGMHPGITLWHFTLPLWFSESGGFERKDSPEIFARYCAFVVEHMKDYCHHYATMNEPIVFASNGWNRGTWPPFKRFALFDLFSITNSGRQHEARYQKGIAPFFLYLRVVRNLASAHNKAYDAIKEVLLASDVSVVKHVILFRANNNPFNILIAKFINWWWTYRFMNEVARKCDSIGLNYYFQRKFGDTKTYQKTDMDWDMYKKPLYVSEAGIADAKDDRRAGYIKTQVEAMWRAIQDGVDVRGHFYWSLLDNYEWALGFEKRFGLVEVDFETLERKIRPSAYVYKEICENNAVQ